MYAQYNSSFSSCLFCNSSRIRMKFLHMKVHNGNRSGDCYIISFAIPTLQLKQYQGDLVLLLNIYFVKDLRKYFFYQLCNTELGCNLIFLLHCNLLFRLHTHHIQYTVSLQAYHALTVPWKSFDDHSQQHELEPKGSLVQTKATFALYGGKGSATTLTFYLLLTVHRIAWSRVSFCICGWIILINVNLFSDNIWAQFCHIKHTNSFQGLIFFVQLEVEKHKQRKLVRLSLSCCARKKKSTVFFFLLCHKKNLSKTQQSNTRLNASFKIKIVWRWKACSLSSLRRLEFNRMFHPCTSFLWYFWLSKYLVQIQTKSTIKLTYCYTFFVIAASAPYL